MPYKVSKDRNKQTPLYPRSQNRTLPPAAFNAHDGFDLDVKPSGPDLLRLPSSPARRGGGLCCCPRGGIYTVSHCSRLWVQVCATLSCWLWIRSAVVGVRGWDRQGRGTRFAGYRSGSPQQSEKFFSLTAPVLSSSGIVWFRTLRSRELRYWLLRDFHVGADCSQQSRKWCCWRWQLH